MQTPNGYEFKTTLVQDFQIADAFGKSAIQDTFNRVWKEWKDNYIYLTELVIALNWGMWRWYDKNEDIALLYQNLWDKARDYAMDNLKDEEFTYYFNATD